MLQVNTTDGHSCINRPVETGFQIKKEMWLVILVPPKKYILHFSFTEMNEWR
jgi:hypothetical protein